MILVLIDHGFLLLVRITVNRSAVFLSYVAVG